MNLPATQKTNSEETNSFENFKLGIIVPTNDIHLEKLRGEEQSISTNYRIAYAKFKGTKIGMVPVEEATDKFYDMVVKAFKDLGHYNIAENVKVMDHLPRAMVDMFRKRKDFSNMTFELISIIMEYGCKESFKREGDLRTISIIYLERWIEESKLHADFFGATNIYLDLNKAIEAPKPKLSTEEQEREICTSCLIAFEEYKINGKLPMFCKHLWNYIREKKKFSWSKEDREYITEEVEERKKGFKPKKDNLTRIEEEIGTFTPATVFSVSLELYFKRLVAANKELKLPYELTPQFLQTIKNKK